MERLLGQGMRPSASPARTRNLRLAAGFALAAFAALAARFSPGGVPTAEASPQDALPSCKDCHEEVHDAALVSIHGKVVADPNLDSCQMCHVGGDAHRKAAAASEKLPRGGLFAKPVDCLLCHRTIPERHAAAMPAWREKKDAACTTCHEAHRPAAKAQAARTLGPFADPAALEKAGAKPAGQAACAKCHDAPVRSFGESVHGRKLGNLGEKACEACHGPGSLHAGNSGPARLILGAPKADTAATARFCLRCHEKDAPDHARKFEGSKEAAGGRTCATCHTVHLPSAEAPSGGFATLADARAGAKEVGTARCLACHADPHPGAASSRHGPLLVANAARQGCEGCHGPGSAHAAAAGKPALILNPARMQPKARNGLCLQCHAATAPPAGWERHPHGLAGLDCVECHDPFGAPGVPTRKPQPALCARCHGAEAAMARMPNHHPLDEGAVKCSDCHDPHRARPAVFAGKQWTETCAKCHRAEASPKLFPHEADRADGCIACHEPHGSAMSRLLRFPRVVDLCLSCHVPPANHDLSPGSAYASCLACHGEIHGSDVHPKLLR